MKLFKWIDLWGQVAILAGSLLYVFTDNNANPLIPYFTVGGWQVLSLAIHYFFTESWLSINGRRSYGLTILWTAIIGIVSWLTVYLEWSLLLVYLFALLAISPAFAIWYFTICLKEWRSIKNKELIHLK
jgi:hypothetical protein